MTDPATVPAPTPQLDHVEKRTVIATNAQWGNMMQCVDLMRRNCNLDQVQAVLELATLIATATPVSKPDGNRHERRAKTKRGI